MRRILISFVITATLVSCSSDSGVEMVSRDTSPSDMSTDVPTSDSGPAPDSSDAPSTLAPGAASELTDQWPTPTIDWVECGPGLECGTIDVPIDYTDPDSKMASLNLVKHPSTSSSKRIGSLLVNPGGPGFGGAILAERADGIYSTALLEAFDIIGFDPRGTGESVPAIDCIDDYDTWFAGGDITPDTPAEHDEIVQTQQDFTNECFSKNADILEFAGTNNVARDMEMIRRALGEEKISYFGFSYGSELGATWATLFPRTVRAAVLDGASDPEADPLEDLLQQNKGFEDAINRFLEQCAQNRGCELYPDAERLFDDLMESLDENPIPTSPGRPDLTRGMALTAVAQAMYSDGYWPQLETALLDAINGNGAGLLELWDQYFQRYPDGTYGNELEAFVNILCADRAERLTVEEADALVPQFQANAPRFAPGTTGDYTCTFWPAARDARADITGKGAGPIVVIGTTGDAATPLKGTRNMAKVLEDGRLIVVDADRHTGYTSSLCAQKAVDSYLIDLTTPAERGTELTCKN